MRPDRSQGYKTFCFSCSTHLSMNFVLLINLTLLKTENVFLLNIVEHENFSTNKYENANKGVIMRIILFYVFLYLE